MKTWCDEVDFQCLSSILNGGQNEINTHVVFQDLQHVFCVDISSLEYRDKYLVDRCWCIHGPLRKNPNDFQDPPDFPNAPQ